MASYPHDSFPDYSKSSAVREKWAYNHHSQPWFISFSIAIPAVHSARCRLFLPNPRRPYHSSVARFGRKAGSVVCFLGLMLSVLFVLALANKFGTPFAGESPTLVFEREDLRRIWFWEVASGHYPSTRPIPEELEFHVAPRNPAIPPTSKPTRNSQGYLNSTWGGGSKRTYVLVKPKNFRETAYPPRPPPGSVADMDVVMEHCDFSEKKYVRDCLEILRVGGGLDTGRRLRRGNLDDWRYIYVEEDNTSIIDHEFATREISRHTAAQANKGNDNAQKPSIVLPSPLQRQPHRSLSSCDPENPRVFHMFWTGPFTDKPYTSLLSFLYTQNTGLHLEDPFDETVCRPEIWMWINPGPAAAVANPSALRDMYDELKKNPWSSPFLHPRFKKTIHFKLWNTTEQLDGVPELRDEWRSRDLFNSGGNIITVLQNNKQEYDEPEGTTTNMNNDNLLSRAGSKSSSTYDRMSVILSDMARFILCHRYGGTYLDADTIFLRDWEELWGWRGAFAYRWSRLPKYNTAVLHMNKNSALGTFLFQTALSNGLDFHPMTVSRYTQDAHLEELLLRLPDALFDSAWLNTENYQRDRPPQPYFTAFANFFDTPVAESAAPQATGFDGFFRGAYSYHFHNFWWKPFDLARNWPDLGERFFAGERAARNVTNTASPVDKLDDLIDKRDLDWATVLKRTFETYIRGERPNMYGEWLQW